MDNATFDSAKLETWLKDHDSLWLSKRFAELRDHFRPDVVLVFPGFETRTVGIAPALEGYRAFMETSTIELYETHDYHFARSGDTVIAEYGWMMKWASEGIEHLDRGREILGLDVSGQTIKIFWRTQVALS